ncbi:glycoprotein 96-92 [Trypanosoma rangeli]|uniref:Glycoprotein 96-92 n=1 Tax=Trypanosoma rangeli TaxID=5698 RepID=A0A3R7MQZ8_TRYRA|nr:glycoprotein 96-92 [Trypanosoma rangeli]RNF06783.1 glycoprotein 96-92 [Trypanosoma rangeli]|eukprot:RNF06783.1 glycoprotein 96-92 [Trypanosoma rangeli]
MICRDTFGGGSPAGPSPGRREYEIICAQLENILSEACSEPPSSEHCVFIEKRITELQGALEEAEHCIREKQRLAREGREKRLADLQLRRLQLYEEKMAQLRKEFERRQKLVLGQMEEKRFYYNQRNEIVGERIKSYKNSALNAQAVLVEKAEAEREKREKRLARLKEERARSIQKHKEKARLRMEHSREVVKYRKQEEEAARREKRLAYMRHEEEIAKLQMEADVPWQRESGTRNFVRCLSHNRSATDDGVSKATTRYKPHEALVKELKEKEERQKARYEEEKAARLYEIQLRAHTRKNRIERQRENYMALLDKRVQRNEDIIKMAREKRRRGEAAKSIREARGQGVGESVTRDLEEHRKRAEDLELQRRQEALVKNYCRWNDRANRVIMQLQNAIQADDKIRPLRNRKELFLPRIPFVHGL